MLGGRVVMSTCKFQSQSLYFVYYAYLYVEI